jgi:hypothetical protein
MSGDVASLRIVLLCEFLPPNWLVLPQVPDHLAGAILLFLSAFGAVVGQRVGQNSCGRKITILLTTQYVKVSFFKHKNYCKLN